MTKGDEPSAAAEDDLHRQFREALERKRAKSGSGRSATPESGHGVGAASNDKTKRQFRRKSGG